jgi:hypothetical protein
MVTEMTGRPSVKVYPHNGETDDIGEMDARSARDLAAESDYQPEYQQPARRPVGDRENAFHLLAWIAEGASGLVEELRHNDLGLSEEFWIHLYAARRESLLTARAFVNSLLAKFESDAQKAQEREKRQERRGGVSIDF